MIRILVALLLVASSAFAQKHGDYFFVRITPEGFDESAVEAINDLMDDLKPEIKNHTECDCYIFLVVNQKDTDLVVAVGKTANPQDPTITVTGITEPYRLPDHLLTELAKMIENKARLICKLEDPDKKLKAD